MDNVELDIVIPNQKLLKENPKESLIISFPKSANLNKRNQRNLEIKKNSYQRNI